MGVVLVADGLESIVSVRGSQDPELRVLQRCLHTSRRSKRREVERSARNKLYDDVEQDGEIRDESELLYE